MPSMHRLLSLEPQEIFFAFLLLLCPLFFIYYRLILLLKADYFLLKSNMLFKIKSFVMGSLKPVKITLDQLSEAFGSLRMVLSLSPVTFFRDLNAVHFI